MSLRAARGRIEAGARADPAAAAGSGAALPPGQSRLYASCIGIAIKSRTLLQIETGGSRYLLAPHVIYRAPSGETKVLGLEISADLAMEVLRSVTLDAAAIRFLRNTPIRFLPRPRSDLPDAPVAGEMISSVFEAGAARRGPAPAR